MAILLAAFRELIAAGDSVVVIEHHLDVMAAADWIIDLGPEGGDGGGEVVCEGPPAAVAAEPRSHTGRELRAHLAARTRHDEAEGADRRVSTGTAARLRAPTAPDRAPPRAPAVRGESRIRAPAT